MAKKLMNAIKCLCLLSLFCLTACESDQEDEPTVQEQNERWRKHSEGWQQAYDQTKNTNTWS